MRWCFSHQPGVEPQVSLSARTPRFMRWTEHWSRTYHVSAYNVERVGTLTNIRQALNTSACNTSTYNPIRVIADTSLLCIRKEAARNHSFEACIWSESTNCSVWSLRLASTEVPWLWCDMFCLFRSHTRLSLFVEDKACFEQQQKMMRWDQSTA